MIRLPSRRSSPRTSTSSRLGCIAADGRANVTQSLLDWLDAHTDYEPKTVRDFEAGDECYN